ncbi:hypothetical protein L228DRAFT_263114 [Xylona heveae TC161]|uniref:Kinetochore protein Sos7 coiled-coil domain-containing protein n=1 Tax=Xylona heveae (strain CBS 132557 / TC161) TaxID=1328760 RepID=A0A165AH94_XYLHT|nr:hypothetical protein L228DRAFT_263114 [Xylona heveae TC161]KZF20470.1 hypothetical protein L228DRAFT_263114 [Xylona heveae TC161]
MADSPEELLSTIEDFLASRVLSIIQLSEPLTNEIRRAPNTRSRKRSDASTDEFDLSAFDDQTPAGLEVELAHYKELFSKLRFSFVEQLTKEKFLRALLTEPPVLVEPQQNVELEEELKSVKAELKAQKNGVEELLSQIESRGRALAKRYEEIQLQTIQLRELPPHIAQLEESIESLRTEQAPVSDNPDLNLSLDASTELLEEREAKLAEVKHQVAALQSMLPRRQREVDRLKAELRPLEEQRAMNMAAATEALRRKEQGTGGIEEDLETRARWWKAVQASMTELVKAGN